MFPSYINYLAISLALESCRILSLLSVTSIGRQHITKAKVISCQERRVKCRLMHFDIRYQMVRGSSGLTFLLGEMSSREKRTWNRRHRRQIRFSFRLRPDSRPTPVYQQRAPPSFQSSERHLCCGGEGDGACTAMGGPERINLSDLVKVWCVFESTYIPPFRIAPCTYASPVSHPGSPLTTVTIVYAKLMHPRNTHQRAMLHRLFLVHLPNRLKNVEAFDCVNSVLLLASLKHPHIHFMLFPSNRIVSGRVKTT